MIRGELSYDSMCKWLHLYEDNLIEIINRCESRGHEEACRFMIAIIQDKLHEYDRKIDAVNKRRHWEVVDYININTEFMN
jgi:hypothetical protein